MSAEVHLTTHSPITVRAWTTHAAPGSALLALRQGDDGICLSGDPSAVRDLLLQMLAAHDEQWPREPERCPHCGAGLDADGRCPHAADEPPCDWCGAAPDECECRFVLTEAGRAEAERLAANR